MYKIRLYRKINNYEDSLVELEIEKMPEWDNQKFSEFPLDIMTHGFLNLYKENCTQIINLRLFEKIEIERIENEFKKTVKNKR